MRLIERVAGFGVSQAYAVGTEATTQTSGQAIINNPVYPFLLCQLVSLSTEIKKSPPKRIGEDFYVFNPFV